MRPDDHFHAAIDSAKIVVADTSPLNYLVQLDCDFLLPALYKSVIAPPSMIAELSRSGAPQQVAAWASSLPNWIEVQSWKSAPDAKLSLLHMGERDAIQLAIELRASKVLIDEQRGRREAHSRGFTTVGTVGVLIAGQQAGLIDAHEAFDRLVVQTTFRTTAALRESFEDALRMKELN